jgi:plastocyanin
MKRMAILMSAVLAFGLAACGGGGETTSSPPAVTATSPTATSPTATETSGETRVAMEDNRFDPNSLTVASGAELELDNEGQNPHTFTIDGEDVDEQVNAGENAKVTLDLAAGTYQFYCKFHKSLGMVGSLTVS